MVFPLTQCSKYGQFTSVCQTALLQGVDDFWLAAAQEGIGGFFKRDGEGDARLIGGTQLLRVGDALLYCLITGFAGCGEAQVGGGVFVGAVDQGTVG